MGLFLVFIITSLCFFAFALDSLEDLVKRIPNSAYISLPLTLLIGVFLLILMKFSKLSWTEFGIGKSNWRQAVIEGVIYPIPLLGACLLLKWMLILFHPEYFQHPFFEPFAMIQDPEDRTWLYWMSGVAVYSLFMVPIQELLTRGALQGLLEDFLVGKHKVLVAILCSNLMFSTIHVYFSFHIGIIVFFGGIYIGWIYSRNHNLISSWIAHAVLGVWFLSVLGSAIAIQKL
jgi:hypothetical protein